VWHVECIAGGILTRKPLIERIDRVDALEAVREDWNTLLETNETRTVELTYEWQMTHWKHFHADAKLFVLVVREAGSIVAIAPLKLRRTGVPGIGGRRLEFIAAEESNYQDFIIGDRREEILECILDYLASHRMLWDVLSLRHVPETSTTARFLLDRLDSRLLRRVETDRCILLTLDKTWEEYAASSEKARKKVAYRTRKLERLGGELTYFHCSSEELFQSTLREFFALHRKRWTQTDTPSQFNDSRYCEFYLEVTPQLLPDGHIDLFVLRAGGRPVALLYCLVFGQQYTQQLTAYDPEYARGSPSLVMHEFFVREAFARDVEVFDFGHYYPYKELWADRLKTRMNFEIYPKAAFPYLIYALATVYGLLRPSLRQITPLLKCVRYLRGRARSSSEPIGETPDDSASS